MVPEVSTLPLYTEARLQPLVRWVSPAMACDQLVSVRRPTRLFTTVLVQRRSFGGLQGSNRLTTVALRALPAGKHPVCSRSALSSRSARYRQPHLDRPCRRDEGTKGRRDELDQPVSTTRRCDPAGTDDQDTPMLRRRFDRFSEMGDRINGRHQGQQPSRCINRPNTRPYSTDRSPTPLANPESSTQD